MAQWFDLIPWSMSMLSGFLGVFGKAANLTYNQVFPFEKDVIMYTTCLVPRSGMLQPPDCQPSSNSHALPLSLICAAVSYKCSSWPLQPFPVEHIWTGQFLFEFSQEYLFLFQTKAANMYPPLSSSALNYCFYFSAFINRYIHELEFSHVHFINGLLLTHS